jgi:HD superfamily phosphohydrolase
MNNNFEVLKNEVCKVIENNLSNNEQSVLKFLNTILIKFESKLTVRKNMSIKDFKNLLCNSSTSEDFKNYLNRLNANKCYEIDTLEDYEEAIAFNEEYTKDYEKNIEAFEQYKKFLDSKVKFNENLYIIEYPEN